MLCIRRHLIQSNMNLIYEHVDIDKTKTANDSMKY